jgi:hypothetical protein
MQARRPTVAFRITAWAFALPLLLLPQVCLSSNPFPSGSSSFKHSNSLLGLSTALESSFVTACTDSGALDSGALQLLAKGISADSTAAYIAKVQLSGPCHALGFIHMQGSPTTNLEANEPEQNGGHITVLTNEQQQLANELQTPLDSSQLLYVNSSSKPAVAGDAIQLQLLVTVNHDAPFFSSLALCYVAKGCGGNSRDSSGSSSSSQPASFLIEPAGLPAGSGLNEATYQRLSINKQGDDDAPLEVRSCTCCLLTARLPRVAAAAGQPHRNMALNVELMLSSFSMAQSG